jgi:hypothetical protein
MVSHRRPDSLVAVADRPGAEGRTGMPAARTVREFDAAAPTASVEEKINMPSGGVT